MGNSESTVSLLLDEGAWVLGHSVRVRERAVALQRDVRESLLAFRSHRFRPIFGASDVGEDPRVSRLLSEFCSGNEPPKSYVGQSRGSVCQVCGKTIKAEDLEYDVVAGPSELRLDAACYASFIDTFAREPRAATGGERSTS
jgi:hypothetical protein